MTDFIQHTQESAPEASKETVAAVTKAYGFLPNLIATFAESPAVVKAYPMLSDLFGSTSLSATEQQIILLEVSRINGCEYCMAAHSTISQMQNVSQEVIDGLRGGTPLADAKLEALRHFTQLMVEKRGWASEQDIQAFLNAGYSKANVLDVILGISLKTLSNYTNHIAQTPLDEAFASNRWESA